MKGSCWLQKMSWLMGILGKSRRERIRNEIICEKMNKKKKVIDNVRKRRLTWLGHITRMENGRLSILTLFIHSFINSGNFYSASSSPHLLRGAPDYITRILYRSFKPKRTGNCRLRTCPMSVHVAARVGVEPTTLRLKVIASTNAPPRPTT